MMPVRRYTDSSEVAKAGNGVFSSNRCSDLLFFKLSSDGSLKFLRLLEYRLERGAVGMGIRGMFVLEKYTGRSFG